MRQRLARGGGASAIKSARSNYDEVSNSRPGGRVNTKDELREVLLRRLRGDEPREETTEQLRSASRQSMNRAGEEQHFREESPAVVHNIDANNRERIDDGHLQGRWDEKLRSLQTEKSQLEKILMDRDAELAALRQKESSLSSGCDK